MFRHQKLSAGLCLPSPTAAVCLCGAALCLLLTAVRGARAANITKANNTTTLDQGASWVGGTAPGNADIGLWDGTVMAGNTTVSMSGSGSDKQWTGLKIGSSTTGNPAGDITINSVGTRGLKLSSSLDMSDATVHLTINLDHITVLTGPVTVTHGDRISFNGALQFGNATGLNFVSGDVTLTKLNLSDGTSARNGASIGGDSNVTINSMNTSTITSATSSLIYNGSATLLIPNANPNWGAFAGTGTFTLGTTLTSGTLAIGNNGALGTSNITLTGGTLRADGGAINLPNATTINGAVTAGGTQQLTLSGAVTLTGSANLNVAGSQPLTISGPTTINSAVTIGGTQQLNLNGAVTMASGTNLNVASAQPLTIGVATTLTGDSTISGNQAISFTNSVTSSGSITRTLTVTNSANTTLSGSVNLQPDGGTVGRGLTFKGTGNVVVSGNVHDNPSGGVSANLTVNFNTTPGQGSITLSGNNDYTGITTLSAGTIYVNSATAFGLGTGTGSKVAYNGVTIDNTSGGPITLTNNNSSTLGGSPNIFLGTNDLNLGTGMMSLNGSSRTWTVNSHTLTVGGAIFGTGSTNGLTKDGNGRLQLNGGGTYTGSTKILGGVLGLGVMNGIISSPSLTLGGGTLNTGGLDQAMASTSFRLTAGSHIDLASAGTLTLADSSALHWTDAVPLVIDNYVPGTDHLFVGSSNTTLTANQVNEISFSGPNGTGGGINFAQLLPTGEVIPSSTAPANVVTFGDVNHDGAVNVADISALMTALSQLNDYPSAHSYTAQEFVTVADINYDDHVTNTDIQALIAKVANAIPPGPGATPSLVAVPEPTSILLLGFGVAAFGLIAVRRRKVC